MWFELVWCDLRQHTASRPAFFAHSQMTRREGVLMSAEQAYNKIDHSKPRGGAVALIEAQAGAFKTFNRSSLSFTHNLVNHPLFELPRLAKLAQTVIDAKGQSYVLSRVAESVPNIRKQWQDF